MHRESALRKGCPKRATAESIYMSNKLFLSNDSFRRVRWAAAL